MSPVTFSSGMRLAFGLADQEPGNLIGHFEKPLGDADIDHHDAGNKLRGHAKRRQRGVAACQRRGTFRQAKFGKRLGRYQRFSRRRDEGLQACSPDRRRIADFRRQRDGLDTEQAKRPSADLDAAFENGGYRPAGAAQVDEELLVEGGAVAADQSRRSGAAESGGRAVVTVSSLLVQRLHAAPQRGRGNQADQQCGELHRMPPPMAQQDLENPQDAVHAISPALRLT